MKISAAELGGLSLGEFIAKVGGIYENSPWVAERAHASGPFQSLTECHKAMAAAVANASDDEKVALLRAHPDLAGRAAIAGDVTAESAEEQARAGLDRLTAEEMGRLTALNARYRDRFGHPFILAVRHATKHTIFASLAARVDRQPAAERDECLRQVNKIAWMRLLALATHAVDCGGNKLTCHVLDTAQGCPAKGMRLTLHRLVPADGATATPAARELVGSFVTNSDGRLDGPALQGAALTAGVYEWTFYCGDYFAAQCLSGAGGGAGGGVGGTPFLDEVPLRFGIDNPEAHYHVPLLASPWALSTYRGS